MTILSSLGTRTKGLNHLSSFSYTDGLITKISNSMCYISLEIIMILR